MILSWRNVHDIRVVTRMLRAGRSLRSRNGSDSLRCIVSLGVCDVLGVTLPASMILFVARMDESFVSDEEVAAREGLGADIADERLLFCVCADVSLEMLLQLLVSRVRRGRR
jgi:hypothetical protein